VSALLKSASLCCLVLLVGCGERNPRREVSGTVTLAGENLDEGVIEFHPISAADPDLPATNAGAVIAEGKYLIPAEQGLVPGKYRVLITSGDGVTPADPEGIPGPSGNFVSKDRIPPEYNQKSTIEVEVADADPNTFDFDIP
jgi:hypothetical protein